MERSGAEPRDASPSADHHEETGGGATPLGVDERALRAARSNCTLLIIGETGVGKGYLAKRLHRLSPRGQQPFIPVNCGAIPESIVDSQLFGHVRGAFSGATADHRGLVRAAENGTLFLDEVGELPGTAQLRLLRLLQDREVQPVGHDRPVVVDVRVMAATNGDLRQGVREKRFREDLLFRLDVVRIPVKPLRERPRELPVLLEDFNREFAELYRQPRLEFDAAALEHMRSCPWPGNLRQLRTVLERLHVLCPGEFVTLDRLIEVGHAGDAPELGVAWPQPGGQSRPRQKDLRRVLAQHDGSVTRAAAELGVHRSTVYRWLQSRMGTVERPFPDRDHEKV